MNALETLQNYRLPTDVKSISERINDKIKVYMLARKIVDENGYEKHEIETINSVINKTDIALLCELAEKGERYEKAIAMIKKEWKDSSVVVATINQIETYERDLRTEAEGK